MVALAAAFSAICVSVPSSAAQQPSPDLYSQLHYRHIGPIGNRLVAAVGIPGDPLVYYAGAAAGGVWKTVDGGLRWTPIFDSVAVPAVGALAVAPSDPSIVWAGTGEPFIRSNVSVGNGVWKSTDGGAHWTHMGLEGTGRIARIIVHPTNPDVVYVAAVGHAYTPQQERGIYRTTDGGATWTKVLFVDENTGASDLVMDPANPRHLLAGMWQFELHTWGRVSGGPGSGIYVTRDGGDNWTRLEGHGLPEPPVGKIGLCVTPRDANRIYALIETSDGVPWQGHANNGELWRSDDGGTEWKVVNFSHAMAARQAYYTRCAVSTDDADEAYFVAADFSRTLDGGEHVNVTSGDSVPNWDHHDMWIDPQNGDRMIVAGDGGISISQNRGKTWFRVQLPVAQLYHVTVDNQVPYYVYANRQDGPSVRAPSNSRTGAGITRGMWHEVGGGESGFATPDTMVPDLVWSSTSGWGAGSGIVVRYNEKTRQFRNVEVWPEASIGWPAKDVKYRFQWTFPLLISPHDHNTVYVASQFVHRTTNGGQSWQVVSPDLTTHDTTKMGISGGLTPDNLGVEYCCVIYALDESPVEQGVLWAGTNDGLLHVSRDAGATWTDVTNNIPNLPPLGIVRNIDASRWSAGKAYVTVDRHQMGDFAPYVFKTEDFGRHWTTITTGIPSSPVSFTRNVREDPVRPGLLYLGTENALYVSFDDGAHWQPLQTNLPPAPMYWIQVQPRFNDLVVGTYGRGIWILDDVTPLQQLTAEVTAADVHLFEPRPAYRFQPITAPFAMFDDPSAGADPPYGASLDYWLKSAPDSAVNVKIRIVSAAGDTIRTIDGKKEAGINRVWWDLRTDLTTQMKLRTKPLYADWVQMPDSGWRTAPEGRWSFLAPPGTYSVVLDVGGTSYTTSLEVIKDPHSEGSETDIAAQMTVLRQLRDDMNAVAGMVNRIEWMRHQVNELRARLEDTKDSAQVADVSTAADSLDAHLVALEGKMIQLKLSGTGQDDTRWPMMLASRIAWVVGNIATGDFRPTDEDLEVQQILEGRLADYRGQLDALINGELARFNQVLAQRNLAGVTAGEP